MNLSHITTHKRYSVALGSILAGVLCFTPLALGETIQEAVATTLKTNPDVLIDVARRLSAGEALKNARGGYLPHVDLTLSKGHETPDNATTRASYGSPISQLRYDRSLTLTQMLFDGFATSSEVGRNQARTESAAHKLAYTSEQTALKAIESYLEVLRLQEVLRLTEENLVAHQRTFDQIKLRSASGVGRKADQDQIEARVALVSSNLVAAEANLKVAEINYQLVVGDKPKTLVKPNMPDPSLIPSSPEEAIKMAIANNRILKSAKADVDAASAQYQASKSPMYPRLNLEMGITHNDVVNSNVYPKDDNQYAMLKMRFNLFSGGSNHASIAENKYLLDEAQEVMRRAERQLEQSVRLSWTAHRSSEDRLSSLRQHAESSLLTRDSYAKQFTMGQRTLLDLLDTENELFTATMNFINGRYVELFSDYRVLADIGILLDVLGIPHREEAMLSP